MTDYNGQVLPLWPWPAVHFSSLILLNLKLNDRRLKWPCTRLSWTAARDVPLGKGLYSYQTHASLVRMVYCTNLLFRCIWFPNLRTRKKRALCHRGVFAAPGDIPCLVCFVNQLFINLGIPSDHVSFLHKLCNNVDAFWCHLLLTSPCLSNKNVVRS